MDSSKSNKSSRFELIESSTKSTDLSIIPSETVRSILRKIAEEKTNSKNCQISVNSGTKAGEHNWVGVIYRVSFSGKDGSDSSLILKIAPENTARREQFMVRPAFLREIFTYDKVSNPS